MYVDIDRYIYIYLNTQIYTYSCMRLIDLEAAIQRCFFK